LSFIHTYIVAHPRHHAANEKLVALVLAGHCFNPKTPDECYPGIPRLATETGLSRASLYRALRGLTDGPYPLIAVRWEGARRVFRVVRHPAEFAASRDAKRTELVAQARARRKSSEVTAAISTAAAAAELGKMSQADASAIVASTLKRARGTVPSHVLHAADQPQPTGCGLWSAIFVDTGNRADLAKSAYVSRLRAAALDKAPDLIPHIRGCATCGKAYAALRAELVATVDLSFSVRQAASSS
jgi:hypothetical protein